VSTVLERCSIHCPIVTVLVDHKMTAAVAFREE
jgi:hypothetical protein